MKTITTAVLSLALCLPMIAAAQETTPGAGDATTTSPADRGPDDTSTLGTTPGTDTTGGTSTTTSTGTATGTDAGAGTETGGGETGTGAETGTGTGTDTGTGTGTDTPQPQRNR